MVLNRSSHMYETSSHTVRNRSSHTVRNISSHMVRKRSSLMVRNRTCTIRIPYPLYANMMISSLLNAQWSWYYYSLDANDVLYVHCAGTKRHGFTSIEQYIHISHFLALERVNIPFLFVGT